MRRREGVVDLEAEVLGYMPQSFVLCYYELVRTGLRGLTDSIEKSRQGMGVSRGKRGSGEGAILLSEASLERKRVIDRKLRELARMDVLDAKKAPLKCVSCGRFGQDDWKYCAMCGSVWGKEEPVEVNRGEVSRGPEVQRQQVKRWIPLR